MPRRQTSANISQNGTRHILTGDCGGAADLSLAQISDALGFADRVNGLLHASNFTFRGNLAEPDRATASLWGELTGLTWRDRTAEALMLGAALYNRKIQLQELYIRQKSNQFTLSGEAALPATRLSGSGRIFAETFLHQSINSVNSFALFGANSADSQGKSASKGRWIPTPATSAAALRSRRLAHVFQYDIDSFRADVT